MEICSRKYKNGVLLLVIAQAGTCYVEGLQISNIFPFFANFIYIIAINVSIVHNMGLLKRILEGGDENVILGCTKITALAAKANTSLKEVVKKKGSIEKIKEIEKQSDNVAFELASKVTSGGIAQNLIDDILALIDKEDNIVDSIYNFAREFKRYNIPNEKIRKTIEQRAYDLLCIGDLAIQELDAILRLDTLEKIKEVRSKIEENEEKGDEIKDGMLDFAYSSESNFKDFYHTLQIAHTADDILDNCEDASDVYLNIMSSIVT